MGTARGFIREVARLGRRVVAQFVALGAIALLVFNLASCAKPVQPTELITEPTPQPNRLTGQMAEVSPPATLESLKQIIDAYTPQVRILSPRPGEVLDDTALTVRLQVRGLPLFKDDTYELGPHLHLFLDNEPYQAVYDLSEPITFENLSPGTHTLRVFASRPWHESFKNQGAFDQRTFHVVAPTPQNELNAKAPLLTYSRPQGTYGAEPIMLDFYLTNAPLHMSAQAEANDDLHDWRIRCTVNDQSFVFDQWQPIWLKGFKPGRNWVQLELIDESGNPIDNRFNNTVRIIDYQPGGSDALARLVRDELGLKEVAGIIDPTYEAPAPPAPEPEVSVPESSDPDSIDPESAEPELIEPEPAEPESAEPEPTEPEFVEPQLTEPDSKKPEPTEPEFVEPKAAEPGAMQPDLTPEPEPAPSDLPPTLPESIPAEPEATRPDSQNDRPAQPTPALWPEPVSEPSPEDSQVSVDDDDIGDKVVQSEDNGDQKDDGATPDSQPARELAPEEPATEAPTAKDFTEAAPPVGPSAPLLLPQPKVQPELSPTPEDSTPEKSAKGFLNRLKQRREQAKPPAASEPSRLQPAPQDTFGDRPKVLPEPNDIPSAEGENAPEWPEVFEPAPEGTAGLGERSPQNLPNPEAAPETEADEPGEQLQEQPQTPRSRLAPDVRPFI
ncbi:MAG: hypothetical protein WBA99_19865 [Nodosilinea sp.]